MNYLKQFQYVITVAEADGISHAAEKMNIAQPTLSKYLTKLEKSIGTELFDRSTIPIKLTQAGEYYVEIGKQMIDLDRQLQKKLVDIRFNKDMEIHLGISPSRSPYLLPPILAEYRKTNPNNRIVVEEGVTAELNDKLVTGKLDLMISLLDDSTGAFERVHLFDETIVLAVHKEMISSRSTIELLKTAPLITLGKGQYMRDALSIIVPEMKNKKPVIESQNIESSMAFVRAGIGVTLVPSYIKEYGAREINRDVRFLNLPADIDVSTLDASVLNRKVCLFYRREQFLTQAEKDLIVCAKMCTSDTIQETKGGETDV